MLRPLADRLLVKPLSPDAPADSLIIRPENVEHGPEVMGEVVAVGEGSAHLRALFRHELDSLARKVHARLDAAVGLSSSVLLDVDDLFCRLSKKLSVPSEVKVGDWITYPPTAANDLTVDGTDYVVVREDAVLAILEED